MSTSLGSVLFAGPPAQAAVVSVTGLPVTLTWPTGDQAFWDVDGDNISDFRLWKNSFTTNTYSGQVITYNFLNFDSFNAGQGVVGFQSRAQALSTGFVVGKSLASLDWLSRNANRTLVANSGSIGGTFGFANGFAEGDNYFGFRFGNADPGLALYGYATLNFGSLSGGERTVTISSWAYNDQPGASITVGDTGSTEVPGPIGLAGLAAGAAWSRKLRRRIHNAAEKA